MTLIDPSIPWTIDTRSGWRFIVDPDVTREFTFLGQINGPTQYDLWFNEEKVLFVWPMPDDHTYVDSVMHSVMLITELVGSTVPEISALMVKDRLTSPITRALRDTYEFLKGVN